MEWQEIAELAFDRQDGLCGHCGKELTFDYYDKGLKGAWHAHHVDGCPWNDWLDNCVALCINYPENCHLEAHYGNTNLKRNDGSDCVKTRPVSWYPFWEVEPEDEDEPEPFWGPPLPDA